MPRNSAQLSLFGDEVFTEQREQPEPCLKPCIWLEEWYGHPFCYLSQSFYAKCVGAVNEPEGEGR